MTTILIADDEKNIRASLATTFRLEGFRVAAAADGEEALALVERGGIDLALVDLQMPRLDGLAVLRRLRALDRPVPVILLTAHGTIEKAVEAVRIGAFDFIEKPPHSERILLSVRNALRQTALEEENRELRGERDGRYDMVGSSPAMRELYERIERVAPTQARVLILGENGTGKELIARALHRLSPRAAEPFVRVNCAAIPRELFESELFGHEKGAFTGSATRQRGRFQRAHRGTLFLDEIAEIPLELQAKLLRALESGEVSPLGADAEVAVDVRLIAATNSDLVRATAEGRFRQDLYYRLQVVTLEAPALRERREDIPLLIERFAAEACADNHLRRSFTSAAVERMTAHAYPGNVRELRNLVERLVILAPGESIDARDVERALPSVVVAAQDSPSLALRGNLRDTMLDLERRVVLETLEQYRWRMTAAAEALGLERSHLYKKLRLLGIEKPD